MKPSGAGPFREESEMANENERQRILERQARDVGKGYPDMRDNEVHLKSVRVDAALKQSHKPAYNPDVKSVRRYS
jgi:hypothetical protein